jgi:hypothetical protein
MFPTGEVKMIRDPMAVFVSPSHCSPTYLALNMIRSQDNMVQDREGRSCVWSSSTDPNYRTCNRWTATRRFKFNNVLVRLTKKRREISKSGTASRHVTRPQPLSPSP